MKIAILGTGCPKCKQLEANARKALADLDIEADVIKVTDINEIMEYDIMYTPGLAIDGEVKVYGRVAAPEEIAGWIKESQEGLVSQ